MKELLEILALKAKACGVNTKEARARKGAYVDCILEIKKISPIDFAVWTQLKGWGLLSNKNWINKESEVVSSEVLFDLYCLDSKLK